MIQQTEWNNDEELFALMRRELYTPVVGDILDTLGREHQFLPPAIQPMRETMKVAGRAMPVLMMDVFGHQDEPFGRMTHALDALLPHEVYIAAGTVRRCANWGELMTAAARMRKAAGAVVYGYHRDTPQVLAQDFAVFSIGRYAQDSAPRMKVVDFRVPIEIESVLVRPGDIVFGDADGVLIIPAELETEVITAALTKARAEAVVRTAIESGMSTTAALKQYGIL